MNILWLTFFNVSWLQKKLRISWWISKYNYYQVSNWTNISTASSSIQHDDYSRGWFQNIIKNIGLGWNLLIIFSTKNVSPESWMLIMWLLIDLQRSISSMLEAIWIIIKWLCQVIGNLCFKMIFAFQKLSPNYALNICNTTNN